MPNKQKRDRRTRVELRQGKRVEVDVDTNEIVRIISSFSDSGNSCSSSSYSSSSYSSSSDSGGSCGGGD